ncbi:MAG: hypothetical protein HOV68_18570 [Streptomycetaceae bacterium]|nr:hypothetical protein [Streptomycetaceae bacterium]
MSNHRLRRARIRAGYPTSADFARACTEYGQCLFGADYGIGAAMVRRAESDVDFVVGDRTRAAITGVLARTGTELDLRAPDYPSALAVERRAAYPTQEAFRQAVVDFARDQLQVDVRVSRAAISHYESLRAWPSGVVAEAVGGLLGLGAEEFEALRTEHIADAMARHAPPPTVAAARWVVIGPVRVLVPDRPAGSPVGPYVQTRPQKVAEGSRAQVELAGSVLGTLAAGQSTDAALDGRSAWWHREIRDTVVVMPAPPAQPTELSRAAQAGPGDATSRAVAASTMSRTLQATFARSYTDAREAVAVPRWDALWADQALAAAASGAALTAGAVGTEQLRQAQATLDPIVGRQAPHMSRSVGRTSFAGMTSALPRQALRESTTLGTPAQVRPEPPRWLRTGDVEIRVGAPRPSREAAEPPPGWSATAPSALRAQGVHDGFLDATSPTGDPVSPVDAPVLVRLVDTAAEGASPSRPAEVIVPATAWGYPASRATRAGETGRPSGKAVYAAGHHAGEVGGRWLKEAMAGLDAAAEDPGLAPGVGRERIAAARHSLEEHVAHQRHLGPPSGSSLALAGPTAEARRQRQVAREPNGLDKSR